MGKKFKRAAAAMTAASVIFTATEAFSAERGGCTFVPLSCDETGVLPSSVYELSGDTGESPVVTINDNITTSVEKSGDKWVVTPQSPLAYNKLYTFTLEKDEPITWTFQTAERFCVSRTLPGSDGDEVPVTTGIEITFSHGDFEIEDMENGTAISPNLAGEWHKDGSTAVFVPSEKAEYDTEYTVTISGDIAKSDGATLGDDYVFSFYTESEEDDGDIYVFCNSSYMECASESALSVPYEIFTETEDDINISAEVFRISDEDGVNALCHDTLLKKIDVQNPVFTKEDYVTSSGDFCKEYELKVGSGLERGFYIVKLSAEGKTEYTLVQITNAAAYIVCDSENYLIWLNDCVSGSTLPSLDIKADSGGAAVTDGDGLAYIPVSENDRFITVYDGNETVGYYPLGGKYADDDKYMSALVTDRGLYKGEDTVAFFGTVRKLEDGEMPKDLTAELYGGYRVFGESDSPLVTADVTAGECETFSGEMTLPKLDEGYYTLYIKSGDEYITSTTVRVKEYVKPAYDITAKVDKQAIFYGDSVKFEFGASFYEGTPVSDLDVSYQSSSWLFEDASGSGTTDRDGRFEANITPALVSGKNAQGRRYYNVAAYASLPESGNIHEQTSFSVFFNDIELTAESSYENNVSRIDIHSDKITLDRLNNGTAKNSSDYIDEADANRNLSGTLYFNRSMKEESGSHYDSYEKRVVTDYRYYTNKEEVEQVSLKTDDSGNATFSFTPTESESAGYYAFEVTAADSAGRTVKNEFYPITKDRSVLTSGEKYRIDINKDKFIPGDEAVITITRGGSAAKTNILFIKNYNGIKDAKVVDGSEYRTVFTGVPYENICAMAFEAGDGYTLVADEYLVYDTENSSLDIEITPDKDKYSPGEDCGLDIKVSDKDGNGVKCDIFAAVVDEALLELWDNDMDILRELYSTSCIGVYSVYRSRSVITYANSGGGGMMSAETSSSAAEDSYGAKSGDALSEDTDGGNSYVRSDFKDTAFAAVADTDENGIAHITFKLPDNITSWQARVCGITEDLKAGSGTENINVTMPAFIKVNMSDTYIIGDKPMIGVALYGDELTGDEDITFKVTSETYADFSTEEKGKAFDRVNIALPTLEKTGADTLTVSAAVDGKTIDSTEVEYTVTDTYNKLPKATLYTSPYDAVQCGDTGNVNVIFTDNSRAAAVEDVLFLQRRGSMRLDQIVASYVGSKLWHEEFGGDLPEEPDLSDFQSESDGGMRLFEYGDSDIDTTAKLTPYIKDFVNTDALKSYLYGLENDARAIYALAALREPVLNEMAAMAGADNLKASDYLYIILGYCELGETDTADAIYAERIEPLIKDEGVTKYVDAGDGEDVNETTALASAAAASLCRDEAERLHGYALTHYTGTSSYNIEILSYISETAKRLPQESGSVTYSVYGKEYSNEFRAGEPCTVTVPAANIGDFKVISASDSVRMVSVAQEKAEVESTESPYVSIERRYYTKDETEPTTEFKETDIVRVELTLEFSDDAPCGSYYVTDCLPSGLRTVSSASRGLQSETCVWKYYYYDDRWNEKTATITYYARVTNAGEFTADSPVVQYGAAMSIVAAADRESVTVNSVN